MNVIRKIVYDLYINWLEGIVLRDFREEDMDKVIALYQDVFSEPPWNEKWSYEDVLKSIEYCLNQKNPIFLVAELEYTNDLAGFMWAYELNLDKFPLLNGLVKPDEAIYGNELAVDRNLRGNGIGSNLEGVSCEIANRLGYKYFVGKTDMESKMFPLFGKLGYANTGIANPAYPTRFYFIKNLK